MKIKRNRCRHRWPRTLTLFAPIAITVLAASSASAATSDTSIVGDVLADSTGVPCAAGTVDLGVSDGWYRSDGGTPVTVPIRLCAVPNLASTGTESRPGTRYYLKNANGRAIVNSRVSGAVYSMIAEMKADGIAPRALSSYRSMAHQHVLCRTDRSCRNGCYDLVAQPGTSRHQMGVAIDFAGPSASAKVAGATCATGPEATCPPRAKAQNSDVWRWLDAHAADYGYHQYALESWHWDPLESADTC
jgi:D-alanyl-D-alanine carboxypeptidase